MRFTPEPTNWIEIKRVRLQVARRWWNQRLDSYWLNSQAMAAASC